MWLRKGYLWPRTSEELETGSSVGRTCTTSAEKLDLVEGAGCTVGALTLMDSCHQKLQKHIASMLWPAPARHLGTLAKHGRTDASIVHRIHNRQAPYTNTCQRKLPSEMNHAVATSALIDHILTHLSSCTSQHHSTREQRIAALVLAGNPHAVAASTPPQITLQFAMIRSFWLCLDIPTISARTFWTATNQGSEAVRGAPARGPRSPIADRGWGSRIVRWDAMSTCTAYITLHVMAAAQQRSCTDKHCERGVSLETSDLKPKLQHIHAKKCPHRQLHRAWGLRKGLGSQGTARGCQAAVQGMAAPMVGGGRQRGTFSPGSLLYTAPPRKTPNVDADAMPSYVQLLTAMLALIPHA